MTIPSEVVAGKIALWVKKETDNAYTYASLGDIDLEKFMPCKFVLSAMTLCDLLLDQCATIEHEGDNIFRIVNALDGSAVAIKVDADKAIIMKQWAKDKALIHVEMDENDNLVLIHIGKWKA